MLAKLLKFELSYHTKQVGFWVTIGVMLFFGFLLASTDFISVSIEGGEKIKNNGAIPIALNTSVLSLLSIFFGAVFVVNGVMRDDTFKSMELIHSSPISTFDMTVSRMLGVWIIVSLCISASVVGMTLGQFAPWADKETFGPLNLFYYLQPIFIFVLINALFVSGIYTAIAALTRNKSIVYVSAVGLLVLYFIAGAVSGDNAPDWLGPLVDPFGSTALAETTRFWPAAEQNSNLTPLTGYVGVNRLFWGGLGALLFITSFSFFKRGLVVRKTKRGKYDDVALTDHIELSPKTPDLGLANVSASFLTRLKHEYLTTVKSTAFIILVGIALALFGIIVFAQYSFNPDPTLPTSQFMSNLVLSSIAIPAVIIMVFFGGDIIWRERVAGIHEILDATPVRNGVYIASKWAAIALVMATIIGVGILFGIVTQLALSKGVTDVNIGVYLKTGLLGFAIAFTFQAFLVMFIQNFAPSRVIGMLMAAAILVAFIFFITRLPFFHPLMSYGSVSAGNLSEMSGYADLTRFKWFGIYWSAFALVLALISTWVYRRGLQTNQFNPLYLLVLAIAAVSTSLMLFKTAFGAQGLNQILLFVGAVILLLAGIGAAIWGYKKGLSKSFNELVNKITPATAGLAALSLAIFIGTGGFIYKSYEDADYRNRKQREKRLVAYEKLAKPLADMPLPHIISVSADIDIQAQKRSALVKGRYTLVNKRDVPITTIHVSEPTRHDEDIRNLTLDGAQIDTRSDTARALIDYDYRTFVFDTPLAPGAQTTMHFETYYHPPRLGDGSQINNNGTFVNNGAVMPSLGIQENYITNTDTRRKYDLPPREKAADRDDEENRARHFISANSDYVDFEAKICTDKGQIPIAPGKLLKTYEITTEAGVRACRDYEAINPILNFFSFMSADFDVLEDKYKDIDLRIFYHKEHDYNVELMMDAAKSSLETFTTTFGPYQYSQVRIMEFPFGNFAQAFAGTIPFSENIGFVRDPGDPEDNESVDLATYVTMHEIGHQWFAHQIVPANTKGFNVLSEGMTENAAMTAYENELGWQKARRVLEQRAITGYLTGRVVDREDEQPLALAEGGQQYLVYNKASWVFWGLKQYMGEAKMQAAIRKFLVDYGSKGAPYPTTKELTDYLREAAGPDYDQLITDYWDRITLWDLKYAKDTELDVKANGSGFTATLSLEVDKKIASEKDGKETSVNEMDDESLNEWVEIGFYDKDPEDTLGDEWIKLERVRITDSITKLSVDMDKRPTHVLIDPRRLLIERNVDDNIKEVPEKLASAK